MLQTAEFWIEKLKLMPHPEGGYFREIYRSNEIISKNCLPGRYSGERCFSTSIYFLLKAGEVSKFHRIKSDEIWHFYSGVSVIICIISEKGEYREITLGSEAENGQVFQCVVEKGNWFGAKIDKSRGYALVGCTVAPGFDFTDFELAEKNKLLNDYPDLSEIIEILT